MPQTSLPDFVRDNYEFHEWKHATAIIAADFPEEWNDLIQVLTAFRVRRTHILAKGGQKSKTTDSLERAFTTRGWQEKRWETGIVVDGVSTKSPTHKVDCYKNGVALEIEWSNKDPFFDRDLNNFRLLFDLRVISVGIIITKCNEFNTVFKSLGIAKKYGQTTTWMSKLLPRIEGGGGAGCPILVFGIKKSLYDPEPEAESQT